MGEIRASKAVVTSIQVEEHLEGPLTVSLLTIDAGRTNQPVIHTVNLGSIEEVSSEEDFTFSYKAIHNNTKKEKSGMTYEEAIAFLIFPK